MSDPLAPAFAPFVILRNVPGIVPKVEAVQFHGNVRMADYFTAAVLPAVYARWTANAPDGQLSANELLLVALEAVELGLVVAEQRDGAEELPDHEQESRERAP